MNRKFIALCVQTIVMFGIWFIWSFVGDWMEITGVFGDTECLDENGCGFGRGDISWGNRHYLWNWCWFIISVIMIIRVIAISVQKFEDK